MKKTYACIGFAGRTFMRISNRKYTHAVVEYSPAGNPLGAIAFCGSAELAEKKKKSEAKYRLFTTLEVVEVTEVYDAQNDY